MIRKNAHDEDEVVFKSVAKAGHEIVISQDRYLMLLKVAETEYEFRKLFYELCQFIKIEKVDDKPHAKGATA